MNKFFMVRDAGLSPCSLTISSFKPKFRQNCIYRIICESTWAKAFYPTTAGISPNGDGVLDLFYYGIGLRRNVSSITYTVTNREGSVKSYAQICFGIW